MNTSKIAEEILRSARFFSKEKSPRDIAMKNLERLIEHKAKELHIKPKDLISDLYDKIVR